MRTPESYLKEIEKLRKKHTANFEAGNWRANDTIQRKIITAWEGYHGAIARQLDNAGCPIANETRDYTQSERIAGLAKSRDYFYRKYNEATTPDSNTRE